MFKRPTTMAAAFINVTAQMMRDKKVDHNRGTGHWVARHVAERALNNPTFGIVTEYDKRPSKT